MAAKFERVRLKELRQGRRGKHHDLVREILNDLDSLPKDQAVKIPLGELSAGNLRAAVSRAGSARNMKIASYSDDKFLYLWNKNKHSARYERRSPRAR